MDEPRGPRWTIEKGPPYDVQIRLEGDPSKGDGRVRVSYNGQLVMDEPLLEWSMFIPTDGREFKLEARGAGFAGMWNHLPPFNRSSPA